MELTFLENVQPPTMCHMSHVKCHVSHVRCHVLCVRCHVSHFFFTKLWSYLVEGLLLLGPTLFSLFVRSIYLFSLLYQLLIALERELTGVQSGSETGFVKIWVTVPSFRAYIGSSRISIWLSSIWHFTFDLYR